MEQRGCCFFLFHLYVNRDGVTCLAFDRGGVFLTEGRNRFRNKYGLMNVSMQARRIIILVHQLSCMKTYSKVLMQRLYCVKYTHSVLFRFFLHNPSLLVEIQRKMFTLFYFFFSFY